MSRAQRQPTVLVLGAGAIGSLYGGMLQRAGAAVAAVCRSDYAVARRRGLRVASGWGDFVFRPTALYRRAADIAAPPDYLLVTLKVLPEQDAARLMRGAVGPETVIVLLQNGVEIEPPVAAAYPENEIVSGLAFVCCNRVGRASFRHLDYGRLTLGTYPRGISSKARRLAALFRRVGVPCKLDADIVAARWHKLLWNAPFNPMSVLAGGADTRQLLGSAAGTALAESIMREVQSVAGALGHRLPDAAIGRMLADTRVMTPYKTSMLLDYEAGRPMEVEAILGNAVRAAARAGVSVPHLATCHALLSLAAGHRRRRGRRPGFAAGS